ncbi:hypothetical protein Poli38472_005837 [Pythium oligandrum]|uniref:Transcription initiation factor TFIID subunit 9 n=1 Tax=Pythium oligandrum TaxID=41045 RepID=A0A8K1FPH3_PYTOL|nr:hypothetical protein Poli38472_005837 [Pythium oligandrum]|eukprot:TMW68369.1 hypothetical protein Poli38472_005837 [Pythium oligandrum]
MSTASGATKSGKSAAASKSNGSAGGAALKLKPGKGLQEDDGKDSETEMTDAVPLDVAVLQRILESMGADKHEPRVVNQLQEFVHRYVTDILIDAQEYSLYAEKQAVDADDVRLAIASRLNHHYANVPSRELMMELADKRNSVPLPPISNEYGVRLPPMQHQLVTFESERHHDGPTSPLSIQYDASADEDEPMTLASQREGARNKKIARQQIPIHISQR